MALRVSNPVDCGGPPVADARGRQILDAIAGGSSTIPGIVLRVYPDIAPALTAAAGESVLAHLLKLQGEGRVGNDSGNEGEDVRWHLV